MQMTLMITRKYDKLKNIVKTDDGKLYQLSYYDKKNRFKKYKLLEPKEHNGSLYYRINGKRYSEFKLNSLEKRAYKTIKLK